MVRQALLLIVTVALFGVLVPWLKGFAFLDPLIILAYACLGVLYVAPAAAEAFGTQAPVLVMDSRAAVARKMLVLVAYGVGVSLLMLASGVVTVNLLEWHGSFISPRPALLLAAVLLSLTACAAVVAVTTVIASSYGPKAAKSMVRIALLVFLFGHRLRLSAPVGGLQIPDRDESHHQRSHSPGAAIVRHSGRHQRVAHGLVDVAVSRSVNPPAPCYASGWIWLRIDAFG
jgi:hypothetical protein